MKKTWRLIMDRIPATGPWNMAKDEYLLHRLEQEPGTCLRFYSWARPTVSLGYSQRPERVLDAAYCRRHGIDIVRRITGGKLVLHDQEVTYSLCSSDSETFSSNLSDSYRLISQGLMCGLEKMGLKPRLAGPPPENYVRGSLPCFSYPARDEIEVLGRKVVGSAQKRIGRRFLQHGSIPLEMQQQRLRRISRMQESEESVRMIPLSEALKRNVDFDWVTKHLAEGLAEFFSVSLIPLTLSRSQNESIARIQKTRHGIPASIFGAVGPVDFSPHR